ncbi:MAG: hypothetical protein R6U37_08590 [Dehalococcoidia bacterium]
MTESTRDTISLHYGANDAAALSFKTSDPAKQYSLDIVTINDKNNEVLFQVRGAQIVSESKAIFSVDPESHSLIYTNHGDEPVTYSLQIYSTMNSLENANVNTRSEEGEATSANALAGVIAEKTAETNEGPDESEGMDLEDIFARAQITSAYDFTVNPMETHILAPEDWSNLPESEINVEVEKCGDGICGAHENYNSCPEDCSSGAKDNFCDGVEDGKCDPDCGKSEDPDCEASSTGISWPLVGGIIAAVVVVIGLAITFFVRRGGGAMAT